MKVLIADNHPTVRRLLTEIVESDPELVVVGEAANGDEVLELAHTLDWDVAVLDYFVMRRGGLDLLPMLHREFVGRSVLVLSSEDAMRAEQVLEAGAAGYLNKDNAPDELVWAIHRAATGSVSVTPAVAEQMAWRSRASRERLPHEELSDSEYRVFWLLASGLRIGPIAQRLGLEPGIVSQYLTRARCTLGVNNDAELRRYALLNQLVA